MQGTDRLLVQSERHGVSVCSGLWALPKQLNWIIAFGRQTHVCLMNNASDVDTNWRQLANTTDRYVRRRQSDLLLSLMKQLVCMHRMWHTRWQWLLLMFFNVLCKTTTSTTGDNPYQTALPAYRHVTCSPRIARVRRVDAVNSQFVGNILQVLDNLCIRTMIVRHV